MPARFGTKRLRLGSSAFSERSASSVMRKRTGGVQEKLNSERTRYDEVAKRAKETLAMTVRRDLQEAPEAVRVSKRN